MADTSLAIELPGRNHRIPGIATGRTGMYRLDRVSLIANKEGRSMLSVEDLVWLSQAKQRPSNITMHVLQRLIDENMQRTIPINQVLPANKP